MADIYQFENYQKVWASGVCICLACGHNWIGVYHAKTTFLDLECPDCGYVRGVPMNKIIKLPSSDNGKE